MKLIVGLGNPGVEYRKTYHNLGFITIDKYLGKVDFKNKMESLIYEQGVGEDKVVFVKPQTYMNLSGISLRKLIKYYNVSVSDILVIHDDLDIPLGTYRIKKNSTSGGHNGIKSIIEQINSKEFGRLKIGIGKDTKIPTEKYVLSKITTKEEETFDKIYQTCINVIDDFIKYDIDYIIENYNKKDQL